MEQQIVAMLEQSIQAPPGSVGPTTRLAELNGWDSMGMVMFVGEAFDRIQVEIGVDLLQSCATVRELVTAVTERLPQA